MKVNSEERLENAKKLKSNQNEKKIAEKLKNKKFEIDIESEILHQKLKEEYARWAKLVVTIWLGFIVLLVVVVGLGWLAYSNSFLITLLATTTLNVIALSAIIIKGLFASN